MKKINSKKAASLATNKLIAIILVILVILFVLILIFRVQILEWLRDLPGYSYDEEDKEIDYDKLPEKDIGKDRWIIASIQSVKVRWGLGSAQYIFFNGKQTNLLWTESKQKIELDEWENEDIGTIKDRKITILKNWFYSKDHEAHPTIPSLYTLRLLDGSYEANNKLYRDNLLIALKKGDKIDLNNLPKDWKFEREGGTAQVFLDSYGAEIIINKETGEIQRLLEQTKKDEIKELERIWIEK